MHHSLPRRRPVALGLSALLVISTAGCAPARATGDSSHRPSEPPAISSEFQDLETRFAARLGLYAVDTGTGAEVTWRADERFAYASTIKAMAAAAILDRVGVDGLDRQVQIEVEDLVPDSPATTTRAGKTMTLAELGEAAVTRSDNTAANYLFEALGGPQALDDALSGIGDDVTVVARTEPDLNRTSPGDDRDTTTPRAIATDLREYLLGTALTTDEKGVLADWLTSSQTGDTLVRASLPAEWTIGDKSGKADYATRNDIAVLWPTSGSPIVIAVMSSRDKKNAAFNDRLVAEAAAAAVESLR